MALSPWIEMPPVIRPLFWLNPDVVLMLMPAVVGAFGSPEEALAGTRSPRAAYCYW